MPSGHEKFVSNLSRHHHRRAINQIPGLFRGTMILHLIHHLLRPFRKHPAEGFSVFIKTFQSLKCFWYRPLAFRSFPFSEKPGLIQVQSISFIPQWFGSLFQLTHQWLSQFKVKNFFHDRRPSQQKIIQPLWTLIFSSLLLVLSMPIEFQTATVIEFPDNGMIWKI